jgi:hypothetical protein
MALVIFFIPSCFVPLLCLASPFIAKTLGGDPDTPAYVSLFYFYPHSLRDPPIG